MAILVGSLWRSKSVSGSSDAPYPWKDAIRGRVRGMGRKVMRMCCTCAERGIASSPHFHPFIRSSVHPFICTAASRPRPRETVDVHFLNIYISPRLRHSVRRALPPGMAWQMLLTTSQDFICFTMFIEPQGASHSEHKPTNPLHFKRTDAKVCKG
jgi:hypothetical protein